MHYLIILYGQKANMVSINLRLLHYRSQIYYTLTEINFSKLKNERLSNALPKLACRETSWSKTWPGGWSISI